jgi:hypothetical protein
MNGGMAGKLIEGNCEAVLFFQQPLIVSKNAGKKGFYFYTSQTGLPATCRAPPGFHAKTAFRV